MITCDTSLNLEKKPLFKNYKINTCCHLKKFKLALYLENKGRYKTEKIGKNKI
jgi:hypothetical protein